MLALAALCTGVELTPKLRPWFGKVAVHRRSSHSFKLYLSLLAELIKVRQPVTERCLKILRAAIAHLPPDSHEQPYRLIVILTLARSLATAQQRRLLAVHVPDG